MDGPPIFAAALAATALLVMSGSDARASAPAPLPFAGVSEAAAPAVEAAPAAEAPSAPAPEVPAGGAAADPAPAPPVVEQVASTTPTETTSASSPSSPSAGAESAPPAEPAGPTPIADSPADSLKPIEIQADASADGRGPASVVASEAGAPNDVPNGDPRPAGAAGESGVILEQLLPRVERRLRGVQTQMNDLQRRLAGGGAPPSSSLVRLRRSLELMAPALVALGARVEAGGPMSPHLRQLLRRVNERLGGAHASAGALAAALRRSGVRGPELSLLLRELELFGTDGRMFAPAAQLTPPSPLYAAHVAYTSAPIQAADPAAPAHPTALPQREVAVHEATVSRHSPAPDELVQQVSASGSASAGPGGAFSAAGVAALTALLGALVLPRLLTRMQLMTARSYAAAFLVPLQRPG